VSTGCSCWTWLLALGLAVGGWQFLLYSLLGRLAACDRPALSPTSPHTRAATADGVKRLSRQALIDLYAPSLMPPSMDLVEGVTTRDSLGPAAWVPFDLEAAFRSMHAAQAQQAAQHGGGALGGHGGFHGERRRCAPQSRS
jgi:hypothetical protein